ncbi:MAG TPA: protease inhibitor I42 family protein [Vicinamibacterales bacterium]
MSDAFDVSAWGDGAPRAIRAGTEVLIRLPENATTGYRWHFTQDGDGELTIVDDTYERSAGGAPVPGAAGMRAVRLVAKRPGRVRLEAHERRSWEAAAAPANTRVFLFDIDP